MNFWEVLFWWALFVIFYTYLGYGLLLYAIIKLRRWLGLGTFQKTTSDDLPEVTLFVAAYNEADYVQRKMTNARGLNYPKEKVRHLWVTDGSNDGTPDLLRAMGDVEVYHLPERAGKIAAINRGMAFVKTPIVIFSDGNTELGVESIREIVRLFQNPKVGCVSGEKRIHAKSADAAAGAGEGLYWRYESQLKKWDAEWYSVVGAAGELFAIRTALWQPVEPDTLLDDFIISLRIAMKGYTIAYSPDAYAAEFASANVQEELKRKVRIAAGGLQSIVRLAPLLNLFRYKTLSFQYISHRVLRWTLTPLLLGVALPLNGYLAVQQGLFTPGVYPLLFWAQVACYLAAAAGWILERKELRLKVLFVPYYFVMMNVSVYLGLLRQLKGKQSVNWERARRAGLVEEVQPH